MNECKECGKETTNYQYCDKCFTEAGPHECELGPECNAGDCQ